MANEGLLIMNSSKEESDDNSEGGKFHGISTGFL